MKWLIRIFDFYLDSSIHVALAVFALIQTTGIILQIEIDVHLSYFLFFGTIAGYNFIKYGLEAEKYLVVANRYHKNIQFTSLIALGFSCYHAWFLPRDTWWCIGVISILTGLYALPIFPKIKNLRSLGLLKILLVAIVWSGSTVVLPFFEAKGLMIWDAWVEAFQRLVLVLVLLIPFEIRDLKYDSPTLRTLPQRYGSTNAKSIGALASAALFFLTFLKDTVAILDEIGKGFLFLLLGITMFLTKRDQSKYFASFWIESIPILWWVILLGLKYYI